MRELEQLDELVVPDRWAEITAHAFTSLPDRRPQTSRPKLALAVAAAIVVVGLGLWVSLGDDGPSLTADSGEVDTDEGPSVPLDADTSVPRLAEPGPAPRFDVDPLGREMVWDRAAVDTLDLDLLATIESGQLDEAVVESIEVLGRQRGVVWVVRSSVGIAEVGLREESPARLVELIELVEGGANLYGGVVPLVETADLEPGVTYERDQSPDHLAVYRLPDEASVVVLETADGARYWNRVFGGGAVFTVDLPTGTGFSLDALDADGESLFVFRVPDERPEPATPTGPDDVTDAADGVPSQTPVDAARDGIVPELAALTLDQRLAPMQTIDDGDTTWVLSRLDHDAVPTDGCGLGNVVDGIYRFDVICLIEYAEILQLDTATGEIRRAYPFAGVPPQSIVLGRDALYCLRQGDGGLPDSMLCRIDLSTGEITVRVFPPEFDSDFLDDPYLPPGWVVDVAGNLGFQELVVVPGTDGATQQVILRGESDVAVDPVTLEILGPFG